MAKERERVRVVLTMPREMVDRIDDHRFANRLKSRAEAVRTLVETGLRHHRPPPKPPS